MYERPEPTLPILLLGVVFHEARYVEAADELQLWRWPSDARRAVSSRRLADGDCLHHDEHGVLIGVSVHDAARRARLRLPVRLGDRYSIPSAVLHDLIVTAALLDADAGRPVVAADAARELRGLLDAVSDLVAGSAEELTAAELTDLHDRLLAAVAEWADPLGIQPFDGPPAMPVDAVPAPELPRRFGLEPRDDDTRTTTRASLEAWARGEGDAHALSRGPIGATDAQLLALLHHARRARLPDAGLVQVARSRSGLEARIEGGGVVVLDAAGRTASSAAT